MPRELKSWTEGDKTYQEVACGRCGGSGRFAHYGVCFRCGGHGTEAQPRRIDEAGVKAREQGRARRERKRAQEGAQRLALVQAAQETYPELTARLRAVRELVEAGKRVHHILADLAWKVEARPLSEAQVALAEKLLAEQDEQAAAAALVPAWEAGRQMVEGVVISSKWIDGFRGGRTNRIVVKDDQGRRVFVTAPRPIWVSENESRSRDHKNGRVAIGDRVRFVVEIEPQEEKGFAFGSRPTKGEIVNPIIEEA